MAGGNRSGSERRSWGCSGSRESSLGGARERGKRQEQLRCVTEPAPAGDRGHGSVTPGTWQCHTPGTWQCHIPVLGSKPLVLFSARNLLSVPCSPWSQLSAQPLLTCPGVLPVPRLPEPGTGSCSSGTALPCHISELVILAVLMLRQKESPAPWLSP